MAADPGQLRIGEFARRVGVTPELLRAWESRYGLTRPVRSPGGFRLYTAADATRVERMRRGLDQGLSAAEAARVALADERPSEGLLEDAAARLLGAICRYDEAAAHSALDESLAAFGLEESLRHVVLPTLKQVGDGWERGEIEISQEHFASNLIRGRLFALARFWDRGTGPLALLACAPGETHDITLLAFALVLRSHAWRILFLGADTPIATLTRTAETTQPALAVLSSFDPFRREVARQSIERLITDGRIHPARIEEVVEKVKVEMEDAVRKEGEAAAFELGLFDLHPEILRLMGRLKFRTSYGQNVLNHSKEVAFLAGIMAKELGLNGHVAARAAFVHDIGKAIDRDLQGTHLELGLDFLRKHGESEPVLQAVAAHHMDIDWPSLEAMIVQAADAISAARPGARRDILESYVKRLEKLEGIADSFQGVSKAFALQAGREIRIMVESDHVSDEETVWLSKDIARRIENELEYPGQIKVTVIRETRAVEYAK